jgi:hypothetical protein
MGWRPMAIKLLGGTAREQKNAARPKPETIYNLERSNPLLATEEAIEKRNEAAMSLTDPETYGYVLLTLRRKGNGHGKIQLQSRLEREWWPAFARTLRKMARALES